MQIDRAAQSEPLRHPNGFPSVDANHFANQVYDDLVDATKATTGWDIEATKTFAEGLDGDLRSDCLRI